MSASILSKGTSEQQAAKALEQHFFLDLLFFQAGGHVLTKHLLNS